MWKIKWWIPKGIIKGRNSKTSKQYNGQKKKTNYG